jgi:hypothetical protein
VNDSEVPAMNPAVATRIREELARLDKLWPRLEAARRAPPAPGSNAAKDNGLPEARFVNLHAGQALWSAIDHLNTWRLLLEGAKVPTVPILAHVTLLRGAIEGAMMCRWLLEPGKPPMTRVARGYAAQLDEYCERARYEASKESGGPPHFRGVSAPERIAELVEKQTDAGIRSVGLADPTSLAMKYGQERWFRLASAAVHGKKWALLATDFDPASIEQVAPGVVGSLVSASDDVALDLTLVAVRLVEAAMVDFEAYRAPRGRNGRAPKRSAAV